YPSSSEPEDTPVALPASSTDSRLLGMAESTATEAVAPGNMARASGVSVLGSGKAIVGDDADSEPPSTGADAVGIVLAADLGSRCGARVCAPPGFAAVAAVFGWPVPG